MLASINGQGPAFSLKACFHQGQARICRFICPYWTSAVLSQASQDFRCKSMKCPNLRLQTGASQGKHSKLCDWINITNCIHLTCKTSNQDMRLAMPVHAIVKSTSLLIPMNDNEQGSQGLAG